MFSSFRGLDPFPSCALLHWLLAFPGFLVMGRGRQCFSPNLLTSDLCFQEEVCVAGCWHHCITRELSDVNPFLLTVLPKQGWCITQQALPTASHQSSWPFQHYRAFNFIQKRLILLNGYDITYNVHILFEYSVYMQLVLSVWCQISHLSSWGSLRGTNNINILMLYSTALCSLCFCKCQMPC